MEYLHVDVFAKVGAEVVQLANLDTVLADYVVSSGGVEVEVGQNVAGDIVLAREVGALAGAQANGDSLVLARVDGLLGGLGQVLLGNVDAGVEVGKGLERVALERGRLDAGQAGGDLAGEVGDHVDLEGQGKHVLDEAGLGEAGGIGGRLGLLEDGRQGVEGVGGNTDGEVVEAHVGGGRVGVGW